MLDRGENARGDKRRLFVLGLDGVPASFVERAIEAGKLPNLARLCERRDLRRVRSELPAVSSVAWNSFVTACDPATHGIFGFIDRVAETGELFIPTARDRRAPTIWERLSGQGRHGVAINVPGSYPPEPIRGCVVAGFLCPTLERATNRPDIAGLLAEMGYVIDVDGALGRNEDKAPFVAALKDALAKRRKLALALMESEPWDYFQLHIMETDRMNHFMWDAHDSADHPWFEAFWDFYRDVDELVGELIDRAASAADWMVLSDHGFSRARAGVNLNVLLREMGYLDFAPSNGMSLEPVRPSSRAFSLLPGRVYINLAGREKRGSVAADQYEPLVEEIREALAAVKDPETGEAVFERIERARDVYSGPLLGRACDLIAVPRPGYDLRAGFKSISEPFGPPSNVGVHTVDDAFVIAGDLLHGDELTIRDLGRRVMEAVV